MKYIYLDQNKWIELAKGIIQGEKRILDLKKRIDEKIQLHEWAFPVSLIHLAETMKRQDISSRNNVLNLMYELSNGYSICDAFDVGNLEFDCLIHGNDNRVTNLIPKVIIDDYANLIGLSNDEILDSVIASESRSGPIDIKNIEFATNVMKVLKKHRCIFDYVAERAVELAKDEDYYHEHYLSAKKQFDNWIEFCKASDDYKRRKVLSDYVIKLFSASFEARISTLSQIEEKTIEVFLEKLKDDLETKEIPHSFYVYSKLIYELFTNANRKIHSHDFYDITFLRVAIPYCDIVICEKHWGNVSAQKLKLDTKYDTVITSNLLYLMDCD